MRSKLPCVPHLGGQRSEHSCQIKLVEDGTRMPDPLEIAFNEAMLDIYRRAKAEAKYNATLFLQMVVDQGGLQAAQTLINSSTVSTGYTALWERGRLDLTVEAMVLRSRGFYPLFTSDELETCERRLREFGYEP